MMGIMVPKTCWANNKFCNKKTHLLHLVGLLFPRIYIVVCTATVVFFSTAVVKLNPYPHMTEKMENMEFIMKNKEEGRKICKLLEKNTASLDTTWKDYKTGVKCWKVKQ